MTKKTSEEKNIVLLFFIVFYLYSSFIVHAQEFDKDDIEEEAIFTESANDFDDLNLDDLELIDVIDETDEEISALIDTDIVVINSIVLYIDSNQYLNPGSHSFSPRLTQTKPQLVMKEVLFRKGDSMKLLDMKRSMHLSLQNLKKSPYFYESENSIDYIYLDKRDEMDRYKIKVFINVKQGFLFNFAGGNSYVGFGIRYPTGLRTFYYAGANRLQANILYEGINLGAKKHSYSRVFLDIGTKALFYWLFPPLDGKLKWNSLLYGVVPELGISIAPFRLSSAVGIFGVSTLEDKKNNTTSIRHVGLPRSNQGQFYTVDARNKVEITQSFYATEMYDHYIDLELPYMVGTVVHSNTPDLPVGHVYDLFAGAIEAQVGFTLGIHQAIRIRTGFASSIISKKNPFIAKVNLNRSFYNTSFINLSRRGAYSEKVTMGEKGFMGSIEYRLGLFRTGIFALENFNFFDIGSAANSMDMIKDNTRYSVGTGLVFHFFSPVNMMAKASFAFGGVLLNQRDGPPFSFSFEVISRR